MSIPSRIDPGDFRYALASQVSPPPQLTDLLPSYEDLILERRAA